MNEKRNRRVELSAEAMAVKKMREYRSMSVRDVGDLLDVSFTTVSHMENGRARVHEEYLKKFLKALKFTTKDFDNFCDGREDLDSLKRKCIFLIDNMDSERLKKIHGMLTLLSLGSLIIQSLHY